MALPIPEVGLVISYAYVWRHEYERGNEDGKKNRPCVIVLAVENEALGVRVTVAPITHQKPSGDAVGVEIPLRVKQHLGLDEDASWVIVSEVNQFTWPGYDVRPISGGRGTYAYGFIPPRLFASIKSAMFDVIVARRMKTTPRDE
jgi:hypothetical protein